MQSPTRPLSHRFMKGLGCDTDTITGVNNESLPDLLPVVTDSATFGCPLPTEEQIDGLFGGDYDALLIQYEQQIAVRARAHDQSI